MKGSFKLGTIAGIGLFIHWTFIFLIAFIIYINFRESHNISQIMWSVVFILSVFVAVLLHELGHALTAKYFNIITKDMTLLPIGGLAQLERIPEKPSEELIVALAGPFVNIILAVITGLFIHIPDNQKALYDLTSGGVNGNNFMLYFFSVNIMLVLFNLIPAFPMDGGRVLRALLSFKLKRNVATKIATRLGQVFVICFILFGFFNNSFLIVIGIFFIMGAQIESDFTESKHILKRFKVRDVPMKHYATISANEKVKKAVELLLDSQYKNFLVIDNNKPVGTLNRDQIILALSEKEENVAIHVIMNKILIYLHVDAPLENIFDLVYENKSNLMLVTENDQLIGTLDTENLLEFILVKEAKSKVAYVK